jgi:non-ribosomal peptide synthetase component F
MSFLSAFHHDGAIQDIYGTLLSGAALYPFDIRRRGAAEIAHWLIKERITVYHSIPTVFRYFAATINGETRFPGLRLICMGGEPLRQYDLKVIREHFPGTLLAHMYGQTESSVNTMGYIDVQEADAVVTLGAPLEGIELLVLNEQGEEVEELETGEIVVVSRHIATGYWKDPETTASAFLYDEDLGRMYRSGDLGKIDYDGSIRFIGRKDQQVKIRGFRVELAEIESRLLQHHDIKAAVVTMGEDKSADNYLCAYMVTNGAAGGYGENPGELRRYLAGFLPDYMIPSYFVLWEKIAFNRHR